MNDEVAIDPNSIRGQKFRLAGIEINDERGSLEHGGRLVRVFARFCGVNDDPQDKANLHPVRVTCVDVLDMFPHLPQKRHWWQRAPVAPSAAFTELAEDLSRSGKLFDLFKVIAREETAYREEQLRSKVLFRPVSDLGPK